MELLFLGTSSGTPTRSRNVSGLGLLEDAGKGWYLVDCGEGTQHQVLRSPLSLSALRAIFITHVHGDHCFGLPGLLASAALQGRTAPLEIIGPQGLEAWLTGTFAMSQTYLTYPLAFHDVDSMDEWRTPQVRVRAIALSHRCPSYAYRFEEARPDTTLNIPRLEQDAVPRGPLWGQLARGFDVEHDGRRLRSEDYLLPGRPPRVIVIGGDNDSPALLADACRGAQVLVHEATFSQADIGTRGSFGHSTAAAVAEFAREAGLPNLVLSHFSARYQSVSGRGACIADLREEAKAHYAGTLFLAEDFLHLRLDKDGELKPVEHRGRGSDERSQASLAGRATDL